MQDSPIDYRAIDLDGDRSWSLRLVDRLREGVDQAELKKILQWMEKYDDFRVEGPLTSIIEDTTLTDSVREHASRALCEITTFETPAQRAGWWASGDPAQMRHAIRKFERSVANEARIVETVATDQSHKFHADAIEALSFFFPEHRFQELKVRALSHPEPLIRETAAKTLYWDQPVCAENALLETASDPCDDVAVAALNALCWYKSKNALLQCHALRCQGRQELFDCFNNAFHWILEDCLDTIGYFGDEPADIEAVTLYKSWLAPLWDILGYRDEATEIFKGEISNAISAQNSPASASEPYYSSSKIKLEDPARSSVSEIIAKYSNPDGPRKSWEDSPYDWQSFSESERAELSAFFLSSPDHLVRRISARAFAEWNDTDALVALINDKAHPVRRVACYYSGRHEPSSKIRDALFGALCDPGTTSSFAFETLEAYLAHAGHTEENLDLTLVNFVISDPRPELREAAARALGERESAQVELVLPLLLEPPMVTWSLHATLLRICNDLNLRPPNLESLIDIDDFEVQEQLAIMLSTNQRWNMANK